MKSNELRIGNWLGYNNLPVFQMTSYELDNFYETENLEYDDRDKYYKPIPLTEEWLLKFGFKLNFNLIHEKKDIRIERIDGFFYYTWHYNRRCYGQIKLKHVHQLQNLYFALTGEELKIK